MRTAVSFTLAFALLLFGIYLLEAAFTLAAGQALVFVGGILCFTFAWMIPLLILPTRRR